MERNEHPDPEVRRELQSAHREALAYWAAESHPSVARARRKTVADILERHYVLARCDRASDYGQLDVADYRCDHDAVEIADEVLEVIAGVVSLPQPREVLSLIQYIADGNLVDTGVMMEAKRLLERLAAPVSLPAPPSDEDEPNETMITVRLPESVYERVRECAEDNAMSVKLVIRSAVLSWLGNEQVEHIDALLPYQPEGG